MRKRFCQASLRVPERQSVLVLCIVLLLIACAGIVVPVHSQEKAPGQLPEKMALTIEQTKPVADFTTNVTGGVSPMTVRFTDTSRNNPESWAWDFNNDGRIESKLENPLHTYSEPGSYTVTLIVTNSAGSDNETKSAYITVEKRIDPPVAAFSASPLAGYAPLTVHFTDMSRNNPASWQWDFDNDGKADDRQENPDYTYPEPGVYSVRLTVGNSGGSDESLENDYVTVLPPVTTMEDTSTGASLNAASPSVTVLTSNIASITATRTTRPGSTGAPSGVADAGTTPDYSFLWIALIGGIILGGSYLWHRSWETPASTGEMPDLHMEMSGGIEFSEEDTGVRADVSPGKNEPRRME